MRVCSQCAVAAEPGCRFCKNCGHVLPLETPVEGGGERPDRQTNVAGGNIEQNVIHDHGVHVATMHVHAAARTQADNLAEYQRTFRSIVEGLRTFNREWLTDDERQQLDLHASRLGLETWERQESEQLVLDRSKLTLQAPPSEFWSLAARGTELARQLTAKEAVKAAALHLDREEPARLFVWCTSMADWRRLADLPPFQAAVMGERLSRFQALLADWVRRGQPVAMTQVLREAGRHLSNHDVQMVRRAVSSATGRQITIPVDVGAQEEPTPLPPDAPIEGMWEAETNPSVRVVLAVNSVHLKTTYPVLRQAEADVVGRQRRGEEFSLDLVVTKGDFRALGGIGGKVQHDRLLLETLKGPIEVGLRAFQTSYRRV